MSKATSQMLQYLILNGCSNRAAVLKHFENHPMSIECFSSPVGIPGHVLVDALHADLQPRAAVGQHVTEMPLQAVIGPGLYCYPDAFCQASFWVPATKSILYQKREAVAGDLRSLQRLPSLWSPPELKYGLKKQRSQQPGGLAAVLLQHAPETHKYRGRKGLGFAVHKSWPCYSFAGQF